MTVLAPQSPTAASELVDAARRGDAAARDALYRHCLPLLKRWARGRLPPAARAHGDTEDLVQVAALRALNRLHDFGAGGTSGFLAYLRQILVNEVRCEIRKTATGPQRAELPELAADDAESTLAHAVHAERRTRLHAALARLTPAQRHTLALRLEQGLSFAAIALQLGSTEEAVRKSVSRSVAQLAARLDER